MPPARSPHLMHPSPLSRIAHTHLRLHQQFPESSVKAIVAPPLVKSLLFPFTLCVCVLQLPPPSVEYSTVNKLFVNVSVVCSASRSSTSQLSNHRRTRQRRCCAIRCSINHNGIIKCHQRVLRIRCIRHLLSPHSSHAPALHREFAESNVNSNRRTTIGEVTAISIHRCGSALSSSTTIG